MFRLWRDESGVIVSAELTLIATVLVIGMVAGTVSVRDQVVQELGDAAAAISNLNQTYSFSGISYCHACTAGSFFRDLQDYCDEAYDGVGTWSGGPGVNVHFTPATVEGVFYPNGADCPDPRVDPSI